jgi:ferric-dicitrate binding protein FerR (iron transport regulator)
MMDRERKALLFQKLVDNTLSAEELNEFLDSIGEEGEAGAYDLYLERYFNKCIREAGEAAAGPERSASAIPPDPLAADAGMPAQPLPVFRHLRLPVFGQAGHYRAAAAIALLLLAGAACWLFILRQQSGQVVQQQVVTGSAAFVEKITPRGSRQTYRLHDGSSAHLNAGSRIVYPAHFSDADRRLRLEGQAYFDVRQDRQRPFIIAAREVTIEVLGTAFDVQAYPESARITVTVASGKVKVSNPARPREQVYLTQNQQLTFEVAAGTFSVRDVDANQEMAWRQGVLRFNKTPVAEVEQVLERWYQVEIAVADPALYARKLTGDHKNESLASVLEALSFALNADFTRDGDTITLNSKKD